MKSVLKFYKYQGAGNDFLIADNRDGTIALTQQQIAALCDRRYGVGADGLMLLEASADYDFRMVYYNSDGSGGMMCGNGGRCIVAFAADMGLESFRFEAADGEHLAEVISDENGLKVVALRMIDVSGLQHYDVLSGVSVPSDGYYVYTGTRHYVRLVDGLGEYDVRGEGRDIRYNASELQPEGVNVNFVEPYEGGIKVRTYEKGVEDETYACGTGIVASCLAAYEAGIPPGEVTEQGRVSYGVKALRDALVVDFLPVGENAAKDVWLTGPATFVAEINVPIL